MKKNLYTISILGCNRSLGRIPENELSQYETLLKDFGLAYDVSSLMCEVDEDGNVKYNV